MHDFQIHVEIRDPRIGVTDEWIDLKKHNAIDIEILLSEWGYADYELEIFQTVGFFNYLPRDIDEACALYADYQKLDDPQSWQLYLAWYDDRIIALHKSVANFEKTFLGLYESPASYLEEEAVEHGELDIDAPVVSFIDWKAYADAEEISGKIRFITDPLSRQTAVFETRL